MKVTNIGGATAILEHKGKRMLTDPWLNEGIFHGAWHHYPPLRMEIKDLGRFDYIYISHIHEDHCAAGTIQHLNRDADIILLDRKPNYVLNFLKKHDFQFRKVHLIKPKTPTQIAPNIIADMLEGDPENEMSHLIDSALVLDWDGFVLYNANDCPQYQDGLDYIKRTYPKLNLALLPYAGGSGYPPCYTNLKDEEKMREKNRILSNRLKMFADTVQFLNPDFAMPFADQYVIVGSRSHLNKFISHPPCPGIVVDALKTSNVEKKALLLNSGQSFNFETKEKMPDQPYQFYSDQDREAYVNNGFRAQRYEYEMFNFDPSVPINRLVEFARSKLWSKQKSAGYFPDCRYYISIPDRNQCFEIPLDVNIVCEINQSQELKQPYLKITAPSSLLILLLLGHISWNIADAALFLDYERIPNVYDSKVQAFVNYLRI